MRSFCRIIRKLIVDWINLALHRDRRGVRVDMMLNRCMTLRLGGVVGKVNDCWRRQEDCASCCWLFLLRSMIFNDSVHW